MIVVRKEEGGKAEIMNLAVADIFRRRGIARKLLRHVSDKWAPAQDVGLFAYLHRNLGGGPDDALPAGRFRLGSYRLRLFRAELCRAYLGERLSMQASIDS